MKNAMLMLWLLTVLFGGLGLAIYSVRHDVVSPVSSSIFYLSAAILPSIYFCK